ncbi:MAG: hypothetical protein QOC94_601 [Actinoplanes sp.]|nr:hypothetical protein [Actinoplanes sp.]
MQRWIWWLMPPYGAKVRRRQVLAEARAWQDAERRAAYGRIAGVAQILDQPTAVHPTVTPLLTRGQAARSER